jgi:hypothetical protein
MNDGRKKFYGTASRLTVNLGKLFTAKIVVS